MATIFDVAQLAGVSIKTVSRVVNRESSIRPETIEKVQRAIEMLGYEPHRGARLMRSAKSGLIGIVTGLFSSSDQPANMAGLSDVHILRGAQRACREGRKTLLMADTGGDPGAVADLLATFTAHKVEGLIYSAPFHQQVMLAQPKGTPLMLVNCFDAAGTPAIVPDDALGQSCAVDHLVARGHRRIGYVGLTEDVVAGRLRRAAFMEACARLGLDPALCPAIAGSTTDRQNPFAPLQAALAGLMRRPDRPTAICLGNDIMALHAIRVLEQLGLRLPQDVALIGYDNDAALCDAMHPRLSTVTLPYEEMGADAARRLIAAIDTGTELAPGRVLVPGDVVERESTPAWSEPA